MILTFFFVRFAIRYHKNPATGEPQPIGLGWLDDSMTLGGPTEEDKNYIADTGADTEEIAEQVAAYQESVYQLKKKVVPMGGACVCVGNTLAATCCHLLSSWRAYRFGIRINLQVSLVREHNCVMHFTAAYHLGFWWQLMDGGGMQLADSQTGHLQGAAECKAFLSKNCVGGNASAVPDAWNKLQMYVVLRDTSLWPAIPVLEVVNTMRYTWR